MNRRAFMVSAGAASLLSIGQLDGLIGIGDEPSAIAALGRRYLASLATGPRRLEALAALDLVQSRDVIRPSEFSTQLRAAINRDFTEGAITTVDGWMIALTEARLCAAIFLLK